MKRRPFRRDNLMLFRVVSKVRAQGERLDRTQVRDLCLGYHTAHAAIKSGQGNERDVHTLGLAANVALLLAEKGFGEDYLEDIKKAQDAIVAAMARGERLGHYGYDGPGMQAVSLLLSVHEAQLECSGCTQAVVSEALQEVRRRVTAGHVLEVSA